MEIAYMEEVPEGFEKRWAIFRLDDRMSDKTLYVDDALDIEDKDYTLKDMHEKFEGRDDVIIVQVWVEKGSRKCKGCGKLKSEKELGTFSGYCQQCGEELDRLREGEVKAPDVSWIKDGKCINKGESICNLGYACDGCPYNKDGKQE